jgi:hypothetical protein
MSNNRHLQEKLNSILQRSDIPWWEWNIRDNIVTPDNSGQMGTT